MADFDYAAQGNGFDELSPWANGPDLPPGPTQGPQLTLPPLPMQQAPSYNPELPAPAVDTTASLSFDPRAIPLPAAPEPAAAATKPTAGFGQIGPDENAHTLGLALLLVGAGSALGVKYGGGLFGGTAGALYGGAATNAVRAVRCVVQGNSASDKEAMISATYAVVGIGFATWLLLKGNKAKTAKRNRQRDEE